MSSTAHGHNRERHWVCARRISERRHDLGLTQYEIVERLAALGVAATNRMLSGMEHGQGLDVARLPELSVALDCTVTYLLGLTADPRRWTPDDISVPVTVDVTTPFAAPAEPVSWILGPEIPDRHILESIEQRRA
ncbi:MAG: helix-turn-helix domain-containing protein [Mycobacteriales bacterium]